MKASLRLLPLSALIDTAAVAVFFTAMYFITLKIKDIFENVMIAADGMNAALDPAMDSIRGAASALSFQAEIMGYYRTIMWYVALVFALFYLLWTVSQSINWFIAEKKAFGNEKLRFMKYLGRMAVINVPALVLFAIAIGIYSKIWASILLSSEGDVSTSVPGIVLAILFFLISYITFNSYAIAGKARLGKVFGRTWKVCVSGWKKLAPLYVAFWAAIIIEFKALEYIIVSIAASLSLEVFILLMLLCYILMLATFSLMRVLVIDSLEV